MADATRDAHEGSYVDRLFSGRQLDRVAFPMGGIGAGMICLEGTGALSHVSIHHAPDVTRDANAFGALWVNGALGGARVIEGPVPRWKLYGPRGAANGGPGSLLGLPRFAEAAFHARFPFGVVDLRDPGMPVEVRLTGWSPFVPLDADASSLPVAGLEYELTNASDAAVDAVWSFHAPNAPGGTHRVGATAGGFTLEREAPPDRPWEAEAISIATDAPDARVNCRWFRGGWFDAPTMLWKQISAGESPHAEPYTEGDPSPGGSIYVPLHLDPGESRTIRVQLAWYVPASNLRYGDDGDTSTHVPWYAGRFSSIEDVTAHWREQYDDLRAKSATFTSCLYDTTLPSEVVEAIGANLGILKSPTVLRQTDGRIWAWEGCSDRAGCCPGSCTHVWNYAQAMAHLFPSLERTLRETEFNECQDDRGHQAFRAFLPIRPASTAAHEFHAAADGQLGGIMKAHREWRISGDGEWLRRLWPRDQPEPRLLHRHVGPGPARRHQGAAPQHVRHRVLGRRRHVHVDLPRRAAGGHRDGRGSRRTMSRSIGSCCRADARAWNATCSRATTSSSASSGANSARRIRRHVPGLRTSYSAEATELLETEGPKYQYGRGCLSDGVIGAWLGEMCGVAPFLDQEKVERHLLSVFKHNFRGNLREHANPQRATLRPRRRRRPPPLFVARGRRPLAAVRVLQRGVDRHRVPGRQPPHAVRPRRRGAADRPRDARPLRRRDAQSVRRVRVRPLVRTRAGLVRHAAGPHRRALRRS